MVRVAGDIGNDEGRVGTLPDFRSASLDAMRSRLLNYFSAYLHFPHVKLTLFRDSTKSN